MPTKKSKPSEPERLVFFDLARAVAILSIVLIHLSGWFAILKAKPHYLYPFLANISRFGVPMFVFISASLFFLKYSRLQIDIKKYYLGRGKKIIIPYVCVSIIYFLYRLSPLVSPKQVIGFHGLTTIKDFIIKLFTVGNFSHLYFVPLILMFYILAPFILNAYKKNRILTSFVMIGANILFVILMVRFGIDKIYWRWTIFPYFVYVISGLYFAENFRRFLKVKKESLLAALVVTGTLIFIIYQPYNKDIFNLYGFATYVYDGLFGLFWILVLASLEIPRAVQNLGGWISRQSFGIYLFHYLIIDFIFAEILRKEIRIVLNPYSYLLLILTIIFASTSLYYPFEYLLNYKRQ